MKKIYALLSLMILSISVFSQEQKRGSLTNVLVKGVECDIKFDISKKGVLEIEISPSMTIIDSTFADKFVDAMKEEFGIIATPEYSYDKTKDEYRIYEENNDINYTLLYSKEMDQVYRSCLKFNTVVDTLKDYVKNTIIPDIDINGIVCDIRVLSAHIYMPNFRGLVFGLQIVPSEEEIDVELADKFTVAMKEEFSITAAAKSVNGNLKDHFTIKEAIGDLNYRMVYAKGSSYLVFLEIN